VKLMTYTFNPRIRSCNTKVTSMTAHRVASTCEASVAVCNWLGALASKGGCVRSRLLKYSMIMAVFVDITMNSSAINRVAIVRPNFEHIEKELR
jgi:hypothetical protein